MLEASRCSWEEPGGRLEDLARGCPWGCSEEGSRACVEACVRSSRVLQDLLRGTPVKIKEKESKESQVEKKKIKR